MQNNNPAPGWGITILGILVAAPVLLIVGVNNFLDLLEEDEEPEVKNGKYPLDD